MLLLSPALALAALLAIPEPAADPCPPAPAPAAVTTAAVSDAAAPVRISARTDESMEFSLSYLGVRMGKFRLFVGKVASVAPVFLQAQTDSLLAFITLRQQLASYLDVATGLPRSGSLDAVEGSYRHTDTVNFDRTANKAKVREKGKYDNTYLIDVQPDTLDFIALVWQLRAVPALAPGSRHAFSVLSGRDLRPVVAQVLGREKLKTRAGDFDTVKVQVPTGFTGQFSEKNPTQIWFSDDARRVVVQITSDFAVGHATAALVSYSPGSEPAPPPEALEANAAPAGKTPPAVAKP